MMDYTDRFYMIFNFSELETVNFEEILETSPETIRKSVDGTKTFVKWDGLNIPSSVQNLLSKDGPYTHLQMLDTLQGPSWWKDNSI